MMGCGAATFNDLAGHAAAAPAALRARTIVAAASCASALHSFTPAQHIAVLGTARPAVVALRPMKAGCDRRVA